MLSCSAGPPHLKNTGALTRRVGLSFHSAPAHVAYDALELNPEQYEALMGKYRSAIQEYGTTCRLDSATLYRDSTCLRLCGARQAVR